VLATPTTLIALLRTVGYAWTQAQLADQAREVHTLARELYERLGTLGKHFGKVGRSLDAAVGAYNGAVGSLETRVLVTARRMAEMHAPDTELDAPVPVESRTRALQAVELEPAVEVAPTETPDPIVDALLSAEEARAEGSETPRPARRTG